MPTIEIMSPLSDTCAPLTFMVEGEDDLPRTEKKPLTKLPLKPAAQIKCEYRVSGTGNFMGGEWATFYPDGTWRCEMTLSANTYDIQATLYENGNPTNEIDVSYSVHIGAALPIEIDSPPGPGLYKKDAETAPAPSGSFSMAGQIIVQILRFDFARDGKNKKPKKRSRVVASYLTARSAGNRGTWHLYDSFRQLPITQVPRPRGNEKTFVVIASLVQVSDWTVQAMATQVIRRG